MQSLGLTVLVENTAGGPGLLGEHGLAILVETADGRLLFDTGQGMALRHNVTQLGIDLAGLDAIALSHGHYDHAGGLAAALALTGATDVYLHPAAIAAKYSPRGYIGFPKGGETLMQTRACRQVWTTASTEILPGVHLTGPIPRRHPLEDTGGNFWQDVAHTTTDPLPDDQALFIESPQGLVVVLGCAHAGVINTLDYVAHLTGQATIHAVIGGMHLLRATPERLEATAAVLQQYDVQHIGANHCTGWAATAFLWHHLTGRCVEARVGTHFTFEANG